MCPACSRALAALYSMCSHASRTSYLTRSTVNHYDMQPLLMECYYTNHYHVTIMSDISLQDL